MSPFSLELPHFMPVTLELQKRGVTYTWEMGDQETESLGRLVECAKMTSLLTL
jgi:hypothetical protein